MRIKQMVRDAREMLEARVVENNYPISALETPEMIAREMIEQSDPWPGEPFERCVKAVRFALVVAKQDWERGQRLTDTEKLENLRRALAGED